METLIVSAYPADLRHRRLRIKEAVKKPAKEEEEKTATEVEEKSSKEETRGEATDTYTDDVSVFVEKCQVDVGYSPDFRFSRRKHYFTSFYKRLNKKAEDNRLELEKSRTEATNGSFHTLEDKLKVLEDMMLTITAEELKAVETKMEREKEVKVGDGEEEEVGEGERRVKSTILDKNGFSGTKNCSDGKGKNSLMLKRLKELLEENNAPKTWADIKITSQKHPIDPSCYGREVIRKIIYKKKPKRRLKVPFTRGSRLPQRLSRELYEKISSSESSQNVGIKKQSSQNVGIEKKSSQNDDKSSQNVGIEKQSSQNDDKSSQNVGIEKKSSQNDDKSSQNVGMILNIGRQRPLYHEQFEYLQSFENANCISANWAKLAASAVQPSPTACKVSRLLIPVLCDKLVKLIECQDELKKFDKNVEYGMERLDVDGEEERKEVEEEEEEEKKVKRKSGISSVVKGVVAKLVDTVVADEEDLNLDKVVSQRRVGRELKRLNASLIEVEEEAARPPVDAENNLAKVEKEYHQTVLKKKDKIIFLKGNNKRARRRPMKLNDHVFEVGEGNEEEEKATKRSRIDPAKEYKTDLIRQVEASVEHELSNPPVRDCSVKLVKAKLDQLQKPSPIVNNSDETSQKPSPVVNNSDETSQNPSPIVNNSDETYVEEICSLPKFNLKVPEHVTRPPLYKTGSANDVGPSKFKKRKIEESEMVNSNPLSSIVRTKDLNGLTLASLLSNSDFPAVQQKRVLLNNDSSHISKVVPDAQKRIKTLKPVLTLRNVDQQPAILSPDKDGCPKRIRTLLPVRTPRNVDQQPAIPSPVKDGSPISIKTLQPVRTPRNVDQQPAIPSPDKDGSLKRIKTLQPVLPSPDKDGSPKRIKTLLPVRTPRNVDQQPAIPSPVKDGSPISIKTLQPVRTPRNVDQQPAIPSPDKDGSPIRIRTLQPVRTPEKVDQQPAIPSPDKDGTLQLVKTLQPVLSTVNVSSNSALPEAEKRIKTLSPVPAFQDRSMTLSDDVAPVAKRLKSMQPEPELTVKIESVISLSGDTINLFNNTPRKRNGLAVPTEVRFKEIAGDFEKSTCDSKDILSRSQYEFGIHILNRDSISEMVYMPHARDMKHKEDEYFGMYFHRGTPNTVMVGPFQMDEDPQIFVHRGRNPVSVTLANKWCENKDFLDTFWNCHNKVLLKHIVKYAYEKFAYVYKTRKPKPKFINIIRRSLNASNHQTLVNSTRNLCVEPAPPVELEPKKVDFDPVEAGENTQIRSLKMAEAEGKPELVTTEPTAGENTRVRSLKKAEAEGKAELVTTQPTSGENTRVRFLKKVEAEGKAGPVTTQPTAGENTQVRFLKKVEAEGKAELVTTQPTSGENTRVRSLKKVEAEGKAELVTTQPTAGENTRVRSLKKAEAEGKAELVTTQPTAGENTRVRFLKKAEAEGKAELVTTQPTAGENTQVRFLKKAVAEGKAELVTTQPTSGENTRVRSLKKAEAEGKAGPATTEPAKSPDSDTAEKNVDSGEAANKCATENPETGDQTVNDNREQCEPEAETPNDAESAKDEVEEAKSVTPISEQPTLSDHLMAKERQFFEYARKLNTLALNNVKLSFKNNEMNQSVKDNVELTSHAKKKKKVTFADEVLLIMPESPKKVDVNTEPVKQNASPVRKDVKIVRKIGLDKGKLVVPEVDEKNNAAEIDETQSELSRNSAEIDETQSELSRNSAEIDETKLSHLMKQNALSVCKDLEIVRKVDEGTKIENKNLVEAGVKDLDIIIRKFDAKGNVVSEVEKKGNAAEIDSHLVRNNDLSVRKDSEIDKKRYNNRIEIKKKIAVESGGRDFDIIIRNVDEKGKVVSVEKKSNAAEIDSHLVRKNVITVRKDLEIVRKSDNITEINNKNAVEAEGSDLVVWIIDEKGRLVQDVKKNALLQKSKVDHTSNNRKDTNSIEPNVIETIDLCASEPAVPLTETRAEPSAKVAKSNEKQPKVERKIYPSIGFRRIEPKPPTTLFLDQGTSKMFFRVDNAKSILNHEKLQTPNSAKQIETVGVHNPLITTRIQAKNPATNQIQVTKVIQTTTNSTNQVQVLPTTSSSAASKSTIQIQAKNPAAHQIQATKVIEATNSTNKVQALPKVIQIPRILKPNAANTSPIQVQALPKVIQMPKILNPNAATKQSFSPQFVCYQKSPLTDGQEKRFFIQQLIPYDDDTPQSAGEKSAGLSKQNPPAKPMSQVLQINGKKYLQTLPSTSSLSATELQSMMSMGNNKILVTMGKTDTDKTVSLQKNQSVVRLTKSVLQATQSQTMPTNSNQPSSSSLNLPSHVPKVTTAVTLKEAPSISISNLAEKSVSQPTSVQKVTTKTPEKVLQFKLVSVSNHAEKTSEPTKSLEKTPKESKGNQTKLPKVTIKVTNYAENTSEPTNSLENPSNGNQTKVPKVSTETPKEVSPLEASITIHPENTTEPTKTPKEVSTLEASITIHPENTTEPTKTPKEVSPLKASITIHPENTTEPTKTPEEVSTLEASITNHPENTSEPTKSPEKTTQQEMTGFELIDALKNNPEYMMSFGLSFSNEDW